jgi:hypothetical protein
MVAYSTPDRSGTVHAVASKADDRSLCGQQMRSFAARPWPMTRRLWPWEQSPCPECARLVYDD